ncbi:unnamed protein product [Zymoseptoria tritici ST99CH_3D7]|uniref:Uncharacterized protein n=1 Tax=Zymoseptoria tritici (strain ST99CH_3D7) TaxID=1276538 RepID=A0A1X7RTC2_ZYMT9|nr:unnamed protein product [Zymoseptoria tritici ST99CH_3D7]
MRLLPRIPLPVGAAPLSAAREPRDPLPPLSPSSGLAVSVIDINYDLPYAANLDIKDIKHVISYESTCVIEHIWHVINYAMPSHYHISTCHQL